MDSLLASHLGATLQIPQPRPLPITNRRHSMNTWSLFAACAAGEAFLLYAIVIAHTLRPVTELLIGHDSSRPGAAGRYQQIFNWDGLIPTMLGSLFVVAAAWCALQLLSARAYSRAPLKQLHVALADPTSSGGIHLTERTD